ncbi:phage/plasmid primase, P4 family [Variovorax sp. J22R24]|uniref:DNA primase family protein n=1 Tax=Variovorax gracilis TaxID=3053502 RepID=UPI002574E182|nr:phage/plasmid primase, P4 family [Variovorax sp. J22R24]MDM0103752.1 phage/plasmid primase, P4 family [Variovorax sp. J22R24]
MSALPNVTTMNATSEAFMLADLMRSGLVPSDFKITPKPQPLTDDGQAKYRLWYDLDYYKDRIDRDENKYIGPKGKRAPSTCVGSVVEFNSGNMNASVEGLKKSVLFELTTGIPTMVMDSCWDFAESGGDGEDGVDSKTVRLDILDGCRPGKVHLALFDGDWASNPNVARALATYAVELDSYGVQARFPDFGVDEKGKKRGYDDWFVAKYNTDREYWPDQKQVIKEIFALPQVPVTELEEAKKWALASQDKFNQSLTDLTDRGNASLLVRLIGRNNLRHLTDVGEWVKWDGTRWHNMGSTPYEMTNVVARHYFLLADRFELMASGMPADDAHAAKRDALVKKAGRYRKHAEAKCSSVPGRQTMLKDAAERRMLHATMADFDADPDVLAVQNGIVDLRTGEVRPEQQEDMILKRCAVSYDGSEPQGTEGAARAAYFIEGITGLQHGHVDAERERWLSLRIGAALRGRNALQSLEIWHGQGANGKSVLAKSLGHALGDYAVNVPAGSLMTSIRGRDAESASPFLAKAVGARMVFANESSDTQYLDEARVKALTGGDKINVRANYQDGGEYAVTFTPVLLTNALPNIAAGDAALWDRLAPFPFALRWRRPGVLSATDGDDPSLPEADPWLRDVMAEGRDPDALRWLLWWAIQGGVELEREGLPRPPADLVRNADAYRGAQDKLGRWMDDEGWEFDPNGKTPSTEVFASFAHWCEMEGMKAVSSAIFSKRLIDYGKGRIEAGKGTGGVRALKGIVKTARGAKH